MRNTGIVEEAEEEVRQPKTARSYKVAVKTKSNRHDWAYNDLRFPSRGSADLYGRDLDKRWSVMVAFEVQVSDDPSNANYPVPNDRYNVER